MKIQYAVAMRDVMLASGASEKGADSSRTPALPMQRCNGNCRMSRQRNGTRRSRQRSIADEDAHAAMRDVMLASGARKVRMHDSRPTPSLPTAL